MSLKNVITLCLLSFLLVGVTSQATFAADSKAKQPNILFIFADDQCFDTLNSMGNTEVETPNLDRLVKAGTTFTHCYNMGSWSGAVCVASRGMLNTGRFVWRANKVNYRDAERKGDLWSLVMKKAGYDTYMTGKWHVKSKAEVIFDTTADVRGGMPKGSGYNRPHKGQEDSWSPYDKKFGGFWEGGTHWSEIVGNHAIDFLKQAKKSDKPFFAYIAFNAPHDPRQSPKEYVDKYPLDKVKVPENFQPQHPECKEMGCPHSLRDEKLAPMPRTPYAVKVHRQEYYAIITHMDAQIGRILDALEKSGMEKNTYIFFTADHGLAVGQHGLLGKQNLYDHSTRVPFIMVGPDVPADKKIDGAIYLQDVAPTAMQLAGTEVPKCWEFKSVLPLLEGKRKANYDAVYGGYLGNQRSVTADGFKLFLIPKAKKVYLFDLKNDPRELKNLADDPKYADRAKELFAKMLKLEKEMGSSVKLADAFPNLAK